MRQLLQVSGGHCRCLGEKPTGDWQGQLSGLLHLSTPGVGNGAQLKRSFLLQNALQELCYNGRLMIFLVPHFEMKILDSYKRFTHSSH